MVIEIIRYAVTPGMEPGFEAACRQAARALESAQACLGYTLTRATMERNRYMMTVYWDSPDGHQISFRQGPLYADYQEFLAPYEAMVEEAAHYRKTGIELTKKSLVRISGPPK